MSKIKSKQIDYNSFSLNIKSAENASGISPANGNNNFTNTAVTFTLASPGIAMVTVHVGAQSTSDFEFQPGVYLDGVLFQNTTPAASVGNANNRAVQRSHSVAVPLTSGSHTISAGALFSSGTGLNIAASGAVVCAMVLGEVTA
jgi:hypothetical protein